MSASPGLSHTTESDDSELEPVNASLDMGSKPKRPVTSGVVSKMRIEAAAESKRINAADPLRHIGLRELVAECARLEGFDVPRVFGDGTATIRAGFSTMSLPGILENVVNKTLLSAYESTPIAAFDLCSIGTVSDFKEISRYRLLGTGGFEKVAPDEELNRLRSWHPC